MGAGDSRPFNYDDQLLSCAGPSQSVEVAVDANYPKNCGKPRRANGFEQNLMSVPFPDENGGYHTIYDCFQRAVKKFPNSPCYGTRVYELNEQKQYNMAKDQMPNRGEFAWQTYAQIDAEVSAFGIGLLSLGFRAGDNIGIFSSNRVEWMVSALSLYSQSMRVVSLYSTFGAEAVQFIIQHADVALVCASKQNVAALIKNLPKLKSLKYIVQFDVNESYLNVADFVDESDVAACKQHGCQLIGFSEVIKRGNENQDGVVNPAKPASEAYIMYTSGTTGDPKGAILSHRGIVAAVSVVHSYAPLNETDRYLSYLPLAHIFETLAQVAILMSGGSIGYFQDNIRKLTDDIQLLKPTIFCGVPRVFTRMHQVVFNGVSERNCIVKWYFNKAYSHQCDQIRAGNPLDEKYNEKIFAPLRARMGLECCRTIISGAAPLPPYLSEFLKVVVGCSVLQGYGMTEGSAATAVTLPNDPNLGHVGPPVPSIEIRLEDIPDMNYFHTDTMLYNGKQIATPRGEVCIRGAGVFYGYYKDEKNTKDCLQDDGWLHTGDVGRWNPNGTLSIIDRKKNMFKLSQGEYIAVEKIEQVYQQSPAVGQLWVYGNSFKSFLLAVVVPAAEPTAAYCQHQGWWSGGADKDTTKLVHPQFANNFKSTLEGAHAQHIKTWVLNSLREQEKSLKGFEKLIDIHIEGNINALGMAFTEQNNCLTPTFKLRRPQLLAKYIQILKDLYAKNGEPVAADEKWPGEA